MADMKRYVVRSTELPVLLDRMRTHGVKTFLLTNSGFEYSNVSHLSNVVVLYITYTNILKFTGHALLRFDTFLGCNLMLFRIVDAVVAYKHRLTF